MTSALKDRAGAWRLLGLETDSGWKVVEPVGWDPSSGESIDHYNGTGGNFSVPYIVEKEGKRAFLKAIDLTKAINSPNVMGELQEITMAHNFESKILSACEGAKMDKVVVALDSGQMNAGPNLQDAAPFLVFELADGDVRRKIEKKEGEHRLAWWLRAMHHTAIGVSQLHSNGITHQDLKPSNVLAFQDDDFKVSDLGRCVSEHETGPYDGMPFSGDWAYAPPEITYGYIDPEAFDRRRSCDLYLLGSLIFFFVQGFGSTRILVSKLHVNQRPTIFRGGWTSDFRSILPTLQHSFTEMLSDLESLLAPYDVGPELVTAAKQLANPDPSLRGHPAQRDSRKNKYSIERYISLFDRLAKKAAISARTK